jgi:hypothetical protein
MKVYHVSREDDPEFLFEPRVPQNRLPDENGTAPRICVAPSIDQAILGVWGVAVKDGKAIDTPKIAEYCAKDMGQPKTCTLKRVYCVDAQPVKPRKVPDAKFTGELWLEEPTMMTLEGQIGTFTENGTNYWFWSPFGADEYCRWKRALMTSYRRSIPKRIDKDELALDQQKSDIENAAKLSLAKLQIEADISDNLMYAPIVTGYGMAPVMVGPPNPNFVWGDGVAAAPAWTAHYEGAMDEANKFRSNLKSGVINLSNFKISTTIGTQ